MLSRLLCSLLLFVVVVKKMAVVHCFSCRLYGSRSYRKEKEKAIRDILNIPHETLLKLQNKVQC